ncbi:unnamed protein product [Urochloa humidicola]
MLFEWAEAEGSLKGILGYVDFQSDNRYMVVRHEDAGSGSMNQSGGMLTVGAERFWIFVDKDGHVKKKPHAVVATSKPHRGKVQKKLFMFLGQMRTAGSKI